MFAVEPNSPFESSLTNAKVVVGLNWLYESLRTNLSKIFVFLLVLLIALPLVLFFGFWLQLKRKKFQKLMKKNKPLLLKDNKEYLQYKENSDKLNNLMPSLEKVSTYKLSKVPWPLRYTLRQMQSMTSTLITFQNWLSSRLEPLNESQLQGKSKFFKYVPEEYLWKKRNKAYKYWM
ncbi:hypothetical protein PDL71_05180 [Lacibacter sp. MH-610]|uniref:hypothetical protein n=1 Tax=Lacibacter sp. MH-610 TaxID=3020883 RepID=UPI0038913F59